MAVSYRVSTSLLLFTTDPKFVLVRVAGNRTSVQDVHSTWSPCVFFTVLLFTFLGHGPDNTAWYREYQLVVSNS